ncbi:MAG: globin family protein [Pararhizobium sp.]
MQETEIIMLENSFAEVLSVRDDAAALFYERLFVNDPSLKHLFLQADMREQGKKLMAALALVVGSLRKLELVVPTLKTLAVKHMDYGVRDEHYATVGIALLETLSLFFGERFTPDLRSAWAGAYGTVSAVMIEAANERTEHGLLPIAS